MLPEKEGKTVIIHGRVDMTEPAYDEEYESTYTEDDEPIYKWHMKGTETFVGKAGMGEFELDVSVLIAFPTECERYEEKTTIVAVQQGNVLTASILFIVGGLVPAFFGLRRTGKPKSKKKGNKRKKR